MDKIKPLFAATAIAAEETKKDKQTVGTYSEKDFARIATAIGKDLTKVMEYSDRFEAAAMWCRLNRAGSTVKRTPPSAIKNRMKQIANAARKLLWHLDVFNYRNAADDPGDFALLQALASTEGGNEDEVVTATAQIGRLEEIFKVIDAARTLERCGQRQRIDSIDWCQIGKLSISASNLWRTPEDCCATAASRATFNTVTVSFWS